MAFKAHFLRSFSFKVATTVYHLHGHAGRSIIDLQVVLLLQLALLQVDFRQCFYKSNVPRGWSRCLLFSVFTGVISQKIIKIRLRKGFSKELWK